jgi:hypothetical protein
MHAFLRGGNLSSLKQARDHKIESKFKNLTFLLLLKGMVQTVVLPPVPFTHTHTHTLTHAHAHTHVHIMRRVHLLCLPSSVRGLFLRKIIP